jgi:hypothetical protein
MNVLNYNKNNYTRLSQSRRNKTDFIKTMDEKTRNKINDYFTTKENSLTNIGMLSKTVNRFKTGTFSDDVKINTKDITSSTQHDGGHVNYDRYLEKARQEVMEMTNVKVSPPRSNHQENGGAREDPHEHQRPFQVQDSWPRRYIRRRYQNLQEKYEYLSLLMCDSPSVAVLGQGEQDFVDAASEDCFCEVSEGRAGQKKRRKKEKNEGRKTLEIYVMA